MNKENSSCGSFQAMFACNRQLGPAATHTVEIWKGFPTLIDDILSDFTWSLSFSSNDAINNKVVHCSVEKCLRTQDDHEQLRAQLKNNSDRRETRPWPWHEQACTVYNNKVNWCWITTCFKTSSESGLAMKCRNVPQRLQRMTGFIIWWLLFYLTYTAARIILTIFYL